MNREELAALAPGLDAPALDRVLEALEQELGALRYGYAARAAAQKLRFSSKSAEQAYLAALTERALPLEDGALVGLEDFNEAFERADPGALRPPEPPLPPLVRAGSELPPNDDDAALRRAFGLTD